MASSSFDSTKLLRVAPALVLVFAPVAIVLMMVRRQVGSAFSGALAQPSVQNVIVIFAGGAAFLGLALGASVLLTRRGYRPQYVRPLCAAVAVAGFITLLALGMEDGVSVVLAMWWIAPFLVGAAIMGTAAQQRIGNDRFCAACEYPFLDAPEAGKCPECGAAWRERLGTVTGRSQTNRPLMRIGVAIMMAAFALNLLSTVFQSAMLRFSPTSMLIYQAVHTQGFDNAYWAALSTRTLSTAQVRTLAQGLLDERLKQGRMSRDDELWIDGQFTANKLPADLATRYLAEMVGPPRIVQVGPRHVQVEANLHTNLSNTQDSRVAVEGWWIDGVFTPSTDTGKLLSTYALEPGSTMTGSIPAIQLALPATASGTVRVKFVGWIAIGPFPGVAWQATWPAPPGQPGATPAVPGATSWMERFEVDAVIDVK